MEKSEIDKTEEYVATILDNEEKCGKNIVTYVKNHGSLSISVKYYNKIVSNFEAGDVQVKNSVHLSEYVNCPNNHLEKTFKHPDAQKRGLTRLEISIFGFDFSVNYSQLLEEELAIVEDKDIFYIQPPVNQWIQLASKIKKTFVVSNITTGDIYHCWYGSSLTSRFGGVSHHVKKFENINEWEKAVKWMISEFGFKGLPIYHVNIEISVNDDGEKEILLSDLKSYIKDDPTVLCPSNQATKVTNFEDPSVYLPDTEHIQWVWRKEKCKNRIGLEKIRFHIEEMETNRVVSMLSSKERTICLEEQEELLVSKKWRQNAEKIHIKILEKNKIRREEILKEHKVIAKKYKIVKFVNRRKEGLSGDFGRLCEPFEIQKDLKEDKTIQIYAFKVHEKCIRIAYYNSDNKKGLCFANDFLKHMFEEFKKNKIILRLEDRFNDKYPIYYLPYDTIDVTGSNKYNLKINITDTFKRKINDIVKLNKKLEKYASDYFQSKKEIRNTQQDLYVQDFEKKYTKAVDFKEGSYFATSYARRIFRGKEQTQLFVKDGEDEIPICGYFLEKAIEKLELTTILSPLHIRFGKTKTTPTKNKDRFVEIFAKKAVVKE